MLEIDVSKAETRQILLSEPDEQQLREGLRGRTVSPRLFQFLKNLLRTKKWMRKINIPSAYDDVAAVMVFTSDLKGDGLEIFSELHVFCAGNVRTEKWQVLGERDKTASLPKETFCSVEIEKVRVDPEGRVMHVLLRGPEIDGVSKTVDHLIDFTDGGPTVRAVPNPLA